jgi:lipopolysaccharide transport system ATP-binding protein
VIDKGHLILRAPTAQAVDYYLSSGYSQEGQRRWESKEIPKSSKPFRPMGMRVINMQGNIVDMVRSTEPFMVEVEYKLEAPIIGLRVGIYLQTTHGEMMFTSFDTDDPKKYERFSTRKAGHYFSRCVIPADTFNEGRFIVGMNASSFKVKRYFHDEQALIFSVDSVGAPGMQWPEPRIGPYRPRLVWKIEVD